MEQITLYFRKGSSDKMYQASIVAKDGGYAVQFSYGRRGSALATGTKTQEPVSYEQAKKIYDQLVASKMAKGYSPGEDGVPYQDTEEANRSTGVHCQLLNPVEEDQVERLIGDPAWWLQEKHDGRRLLLRKQGNVITGINRQGLLVALPQTLLEDAANCPEDFLLDGEAIGDTLQVFDALTVEDDEIGSCRYGERYLRLMNLLGSFQHPHLHLVETAFTTAQKVAMFSQLRERTAEGVVFRQISAPYTAGRPSSGGTQLKYKFYATASFIVGKINAQRSVSLLLFEGEKIKAAGNVTIPANHGVPTTGQIVECRYLYAFQESGSIYQPVFLGSREDITSEECITAQLKYRAAPKEEAA